jgi:hypothetical protein
VLKHLLSLILLLLHSESFASIAFAAHHKATGSATSKGEFATVN